VGQRKVNKPRTAREAIAELSARGVPITSGSVAELLGISRQAAHRQLRALVDVAELFPEGAGRTAHYVTKRDAVTMTRKRAGLDEAALYRDVVAALPVLGDVPRRAEAILHYVFTELVNNAVDHSGGELVRCEVRVTDAAVAVRIEDDGVGIFEHLKRALSLAAPIEAIGELSKGKTTTDPERHSGQGIFFSSKAVNVFELASGDLRWIVDNDRDDNAIAATAVVRGTRADFTIARDTARELRSLFDDYTTDLEFDRTRTVVRLFAYGTRFVSRSEAKRLLTGLEKFREVVLDFTGVDAVGQGFADEVFRVWPRAHAATRIEPVNMVDPVAFMVRRALLAT
jgi:anti-sigma regulatory factor (Ser/Thr protein kinase)